MANVKDKNICQKAIECLKVVREAEREGLKIFEKIVEGL